MQAMIEEGSEQTVKNLQTLALDEGAFLIHIHSALFSTGARAAANRGLSRRLIALWATNFEPAKRLLKQVIPAGLLRSLQSNDTVDLNDEGAVIDRDNLKIAQGKHQAGNFSKLQFCISYIGFYQRYKKRFRLLGNI